MYRPVQESLVLVKYASRGVSGETAHLPLQITPKRMDVDEGSVKMYKPVQESLVLNAYASSESNGRDVDERSGQNFRASS